MTTPGIGPHRAGLLSCGTVTWITGLGPSSRVHSSAAVTWLNTPPSGSAKSTADHSSATRGGLPREGRVDPPPHHLPAARAYLRSNGLGRHACGYSLANRDDTVLILQQPQELARQFGRHDTRVRMPAASLKRRRGFVDNLSRLSTVLAGGIDTRSNRSDTAGANCWQSLSQRAFRGCGR